MRQAGRKINTRWSIAFIKKKKSHRAQSSWKSHSGTQCLRTILYPLVVKISHRGFYFTKGSPFSSGSLVKSVLGKLPVAGSILAEPQKVGRALAGSAGGRHSKTGQLLAETGAAGQSRFADPTTHGQNGPDGQWACPGP